ncbi:hypothetical protein LKR43_02240 [Pusillimonas sp. MFBS29]|uniref:hypothetical protein n=1 Tax=Pusillimonas sp. MFBS29 TaxID=2886690 RepID=UPI001D1093C5|nr:hypothetical protein [Pusillimonas sp. MFBS29]MCC2595152.1 hypothetical protein [Pusillimonas sp. MFBS29]
MSEGSRLGRPVSPVRQWPVCPARRAGLAGVLTRSTQPQHTLSLLDSGLWSLDGPDGAPDLRLAHAWPAFAWMTLRFHKSDTAACRPLELTIKKRGLPDGAWRELRICVARQQALPTRRAHKDPA